MTGAVDRNARWYEDYAPGETIRAGGVTLTESSIIDFAFRYDPQPFHIDPEFARTSIYGGLIASGWQVATAAFRMLVQAGFIGHASMGSPGIEDLRFHQPVRPGDRLLASATVRQMRKSASRPGLGLVTMDYRVENGRGELCCSWHGVQLVRMRPVAQTPGQGTSL